MTVPGYVSIVTLGVDDLTRASEFYDALGWDGSFAPGETICFYRTGGVVVSLYGREALAADAQTPVEPRAPFSGVTLAINVASTDEVDDALAAAAAAGGEIRKPGQSAEWGGYSGYFADPDGHLWEVAWNPHFPLASDGSVTLP